MSGPCRDEDALGEHSEGRQMATQRIQDFTARSTPSVDPRAKRDVQLNHTATIGNGFHGILQVYQELWSNTASKAEVQEREMRKEKIHWCMKFGFQMKYQNDGGVP